MRTAPLLVLSLSLCSCAAVFRGTKDTVVVESDPTGAEASKGPRKLGPTPTKLEVQRNSVTQLTLTKDGYDDHIGVVKRRINPGWLTVDIATCVFPVLLCIPILVDALTGAWYDVERKYVATMTKGGAGATTSEADNPTPEPSSTPTVELSESERKASARAAYMEGVDLQDKGQCAEALFRFEAAQKLYSAPTHLLRIGQCQVATGKLVEAAETYELLVRTSLAKDAPDVFRSSQEDGKKELSQLKPRIPTLRIRITPPPNSLSSLVVKLNDKAIPNEVLGIARPVNPGQYKVTVWAAGYKEAAGAVDVVEGSSKALELKLSK